MDYTELGFSQKFNREKKQTSYLSGLSALDYDALVEDASIALSKLETKTTQGSATNASTTTEETTQLIKTDSGNYIVIGDNTYKGVKIYNKVKCSININGTFASGVFETVPFTTISYDFLGIYNSSLKRFTMPISGYYLISIHVATTYQSSTYKYVTLIKNGNNLISNYFFQHGSTTSTKDCVSVSPILYLTTNDYLELFASTTASIGSMTGFLAVHLLSV